MILRESIYYCILVALSTIPSTLIDAANKGMAGEEETISTIKKLAEESGAKMPITHYLYTPGMAWGAYEKDKEGGKSFEQAFEKSAKRGCLSFMQLEGIGIKKAITLPLLVDLMNFILYAAMVKAAKTSLDGITFQIRASEQKGSDLPLRLYGLYRAYVKEHKANDSLCDANQISEQHLLIHLRLSPTQKYRSWWLGNEKFKSFEVEILEKGARLSLRPTAISALTAKTKKIAKSKGVENTITLSYRDLDEARNTLLFKF
ncbi:MAG: hypothetical protein M1549_02595 [Candidatus Dependentiae bacterium]|nr:hypothetical protein [Candidatus Dependentiae bacterium]